MITKELIENDPCTLANFGQRTLQHCCFVFLNLCYLRDLRISYVEPK